jgi:hypothetical protein
VPPDLAWFNWISTDLYLVCLRPETPIFHQAGNGQGLGGIDAIPDAEGIDKEPFVVSFWLIRYPR